MHRKSSVRQRLWGKVRSTRTRSNAVQEDAPAVQHAPLYFGPTQQYPTIARLPLVMQNRRSGSRAHASRCVCYAKGSVLLRDWMIMLGSPFSVCVHPLPSASTAYDKGIQRMPWDNDIPCMVRPRPRCGPDACCGPDARMHVAAPDSGGVQMHVAAPNSVGFKCMVRPCDKNEQNRKRR